MHERQTIAATVIAARVSQTMAVAASKCETKVADANMCWTLAVAASKCETMVADANKCWTMAAAARTNGIMVTAACMCWTTTVAAHKQEESYSDVLTMKPEQTNNRYRGAAI